MRWLVYLDPEAFASDTLDTLLAAPLVNQMPIGVLNTLRTEPERYPDVRLRAASRAGRCVGTLVHTPPWKPVLSDVDAEVATFLGAAYAAETPELDGVFGVEEAVLAFAEGALAGTGRVAEIEVRMGLFELTSVLPTPPVSGHRRLATGADAALLQEWAGAFHDEALPFDPPNPPGIGLRYATGGRVHLCISADGEPVAFAAFAREVAGFVSVGPVYTTPSARGSGYATALVAEMSQLALGEGRQGCTLFADANNPVSNAIYERIGYRKIATLTRLRFQG